MKNVFIAVNVLILLPFLGTTQTIDWYELVIIPELKDADFLVVQVDSVGEKCLLKRYIVIAQSPDKSTISKF